MNKTSAFSRDGTSALMLDEMADILQIPKFRGIRNSFKPVSKKNLKGFTDGCAIFNIGDNSHWVCVIFEDKIPYYWDSFGRVSPLIFEKTYPNITHNINQYQTYSSPNCGQWCILFLYLASILGVNETQEYFMKNKQGFDPHKFPIVPLNKLLNQNLQSYASNGRGFFDVVKRKVNGFVDRGKSLVSKLNIDKIPNTVDSVLNSELGTDIKYLSLQEIANKLNDWRTNNNPKNLPIRTLLPGEIHFKLSQFLGPGTRVDLPEVRDAKPVNAVDAIARDHDIAFYDISKKNYTNQQDKFNDVQDADQRFLVGVAPYLNDPDPDIKQYARWGYAGIAAKKVAESIVGKLIYKI